MRWHPPTSEVIRVIVWRLETRGAGRKRVWTWRAQSRNGQTLVKSLEHFSGRAQALRAAVMFGRPASFPEYNTVTALHDGEVLVLKWSDPA